MIFVNNNIAILENFSYMHMQPKNVTKLKNYQESVRSYTDLGE